MVYMQKTLKVLSSILLGFLLIRVYFLAGILSYNSVMATFLHLTVGCFNQPKRQTRRKEKADGAKTTGRNKVTAHAFNSDEDGQTCYNDSGFIYRTDGNESKAKHRTSSRSYETYIVEPPTNSSLEELYDEHSVESYPASITDNDDISLYDGLLKKGRLPGILPGRSTNTPPESITVSAPTVLVGNDNRTSKEHNLSSDVSTPDLSRKGCLCFHKRVRKMPKFASFSEETESEDGISSNCVETHTENSISMTSSLDCSLSSYSGADSSSGDIRTKQVIQNLVASSNDELKADSIEKGYDKNQCRALSDSQESLPTGCLCVSMGVKKRNISRTDDDQISLNSEVDEEDIDNTVSEIDSMTTSLLSRISEEPSDIDITEPSDYSVAGSVQSDEGVRSNNTILYVTQISDENANDVSESEYLCNTEMSMDCTTNEIKGHGDTESDTAHFNQPTLPDYTSYLVDSTSSPLDITGQDRNFEVERITDESNAKVDNESLGDTIKNTNIDSIQQEISKKNKVRKLCFGGKKRDHKPYQHEEEAGKIRTTDSNIVEGPMTKIKNIINQEFIHVVTPDIFSDNSDATFLYNSELKGLLDRSTRLNLDFCVNMYSRVCEGRRPCRLETIPESQSETSRSSQDIVFEPRESIGKYTDADYSNDIGGVEQSCCSEGQPCPHEDDLTAQKASDWKEDPENGGNIGCFGKSKKSKTQNTKNIEEITSQEPLGQTYQFDKELREDLPSDNFKDVGEFGLIANKQGISREICELNNTSISRDKICGYRTIDSGSVAFQQKIYKATLKRNIENDGYLKQPDNTGNRCDQHLSKGSTSNVGLSQVNTKNTDKGMLENVDDRVLLTRGENTEGNYISCFGRKSKSRKGYVPQPLDDKRELKYQCKYERGMVDKSSLGESEENQDAHALSISKVQTWKLELAYGKMNNKLDDLDEEFHNDEVNICREQYKLENTSTQTIAAQRIHLNGLPSDELEPTDDKSSDNLELGIDSQSISSRSTLNDQTIGCFSIQRRKPGHNQIKLKYRVPHETKEVTALPNKDTVDNAVVNCEEFNKSDDQKQNENQRDKNIEPVLCSKSHLHKPVEDIAGDSSTPGSNGLTAVESPTSMVCEEKEKKVYLSKTNETKNLDSQLESEDCQEIYQVKEGCDTKLSPDRSDTPPFIADTPDQTKRLCFIFKKKKKTPSSLNTYCQFSEISDFEGSRERDSLETVTCTTSCKSKENDNIQNVTDSNSDDENHSDCKVLYDVQQNVAAVISCSDTVSHSNNRENKQIVENDLNLSHDSEEQEIKIDPLGKERVSKKESPPQIPTNATGLCFKLRKLGKKNPRAKKDTGTPTLPSFEEVAIGAHFGAETINSPEATLVEEDGGPLRLSESVYRVQEEMPSDSDISDSLDVDIPSNPEQRQVNGEEGNVCLAKTDVTPSFTPETPDQTKRLCFSFKKKKHKTSQLKTQCQFSEISAFDSSHEGNLLETATISNEDGNIQTLNENSSADENAINCKARITTIRSAPQKVGVVEYRQVSQSAESAQHDEEEREMEQGPSGNEQISKMELTSGTPESPQNSKRPCFQIRKLNKTKASPNKEMKIITEPTFEEEPNGAHLGAVVSNNPEPTPAEEIGVPLRLSESLYTTQEEMSSHCEINTISGGLALDSQCYPEIKQVNVEEGSMCLEETDDTPSFVPDTPNQTKRLCFSFKKKKPCQILDIKRSFLETSITTDPIDKEDRNIHFLTVTNSEDVISSDFDISANVSRGALQKVGNAKQFSDTVALGEDSENRQGSKSAEIPQQDKDVKDVVGDQSSIKPIPKIELSPEFHDNTDNSQRLCFKIRKLGKKKPGVTKDIGTPTVQCLEEMLIDAHPRTVTNNPEQTLAEEEQERLQLCELEHNFLDEMDSESYSDINKTTGSLYSESCPTSEQVHVEGGIVGLAETDETAPFSPDTPDQTKRLCFNFMKKKHKTPQLNTQCQYSEDSAFDPSHEGSSVGSDTCLSNIEDSNIKTLTDNNSDNDKSNECEVLSAVSENEAQNIHPVESSWETVTISYDSKNRRSFEEEDIFQQNQETDYCHSCNNHVSNSESSFDILESPESSKRLCFHIRKFGKQNTRAKKENRTTACAFKGVSTSGHDESAPRNKSEPTLPDEDNGRPQLCEHLYPTDEEMPSHSDLNAPSCSDSQSGLESEQVQGQGECVRLPETKSPPSFEPDSPHQTNHLCFNFKKKQLIEDPLTNNCNLSVIDAFDSTNERILTATATCTTSMSDENDVNLNSSRSDSSDARHSDVSSVDPHLVTETVNDAISPEGAVTMNNHGENIEPTEIEEDFEAKITSDLSDSESITERELSYVTQSTPDQVKRLFFKIKKRVNMEPSATTEHSPDELPFRAHFGADTESVPEQTLPGKEIGPLFINSCESLGTINHKLLSKSNNDDSEVSIDGITDHGHTNISRDENGDDDMTRCEPSESPIGPDGEDGDCLNQTMHSDDNGKSTDRIRLGCDTDRYERQLFGSSELIAPIKYNETYQSETLLAVRNLDGYVTGREIYEPNSSSSEDGIFDTHEDGTPSRPNVDAETLIVVADVHASEFDSEETEQAEISEGMVSVASTPEASQRGLLCLRKSVKPRNKSREAGEQIILPDPPKKGCLKQPRQAISVNIFEDIGTEIDLLSRHSCSCSDNIQHDKSEEHLQMEGTPDSEHRTCLCLRKLEKESRSVKFLDDIYAMKDDNEEGKRSTLDDDSGRGESEADNGDQESYGANSGPGASDISLELNTTEDISDIPFTIETSSKSYKPEIVSADVQYIDPLTITLEERDAKWSQFVTRVMKDSNIKANQNKVWSTLDALTLKEIKEVVGVYVDGQCLIQVLTKNDMSKCVWHLFKRGIDMIGLYPMLLHLATSSKANDTVEVLVRLGADVTLTDRDAWKTPLHIAAEMANIPLLEFLLQNGAKKCMNDPDKNGSPPITLACMGESQTAVSTLLDFGACADACTPRAFPPLHASALLGNIGLVVLLIQRGANVNFQDSSGFTPLHHAVFKDFTNIAEYLLHYGADRTISDRQGKTALQLCRSREMLPLLKKKKRKHHFRY